MRCFALSSQVLGLVATVAEGDRDGIGFVEEVGGALPETGPFRDLVSLSTSITWIEVERNTQRGGLLEVGVEAGSDYLEDNTGLTKGHTGGVGQHVELAGSILTKAEQEELEAIPPLDL